VRNRFLAGCVASALVAVASLAPATASGSVTIGADLSQPATPSFSCVSTDRPCTWFQSAPAAGEQIAAPFDGTVVSWSYRSGNMGDRHQFRLVRPVGSGFTGAGTGPVTTVPDNLDAVRGPFPLQLPVKQGDLLGIRSLAGNAALDIPGVIGQNCMSNPRPFVSRFNTPDLADGEPARPPTSANGICSEIAMSATIVRSSFSFGVSGRQLLVTVEDPGTVQVNDAGAPLAAPAAKKRGKKKRKQPSLPLKASSASGGPPTIAVPLLLSKPAKQKLRRKGKLRVNARITFTPQGAPPATQTAELEIKGKRKKRKRRGR
jgi:hypothetical protein